MQRYVDWMSQRRALNITLIVIYYIAVVGPHKIFGTFLNSVVFQNYTRDQSDRLVLILGAIALAVYLFLFLTSSWKSNVRKKLWFYMICSIGFVILFINTLFVNNLEIIHFPQYAAFAILIYPLIHNYNNTLIWATLAGAMDEAYQNFYLSQDTGYYDWNDVITNLVGAVFGLLILRSFNVPEVPNKKWYNTHAVKAVGILTVAIFGMWLTGFLSIYPSESSTIELVSKDLTGFWQLVTIPQDIVYHVILPLEGTILTILLWVFYSRIGS